MDATVLVTGGRSPLGRYIGDALSDRGEHVVGADALGEPRDLPDLLSAIRQHGVRDVVHAAELSDPAVSIELPVATVLETVESSLHLLEAARLAEVEGRIVLLSSSAVYGDNKCPIQESAPLRPRTPFAVAKATGEHLGAVYAEAYGLDVVVLRLGEPFGPGLALPSTIGRLVRAALNGDPFRSATGADQTFHLTHGDDISRAVLAALRAPNPSQRVYNVTGGERHSLAQIAGLVRERFPRSRIDLGPGQLPGHDRQGPLDIRAADRELGYRPLWGLARGLDDLAEWLLAQREAA